MVELHLGDCLSILPKLDTRIIDAVVADPPYGMNWNTDSARFSGGRYGVDGSRGQGRSDWGDIDEDKRPFDPSVWLEYPRVILWGANHYAARLPVGTTLVWIKRSDDLFGSWLSDAEIGWMRGGHGVYCFRKQFPPPSRMKEGGGKVLHPSQKPLALMLWCFEKLKLKPGMTVLDPYMGSGTTGVACMKAGLNFIGIELNQKYFDVAKRRIEAEQASTPLFDLIKS